MSLEGRHTPAPAATADDDGWVTSGDTDPVEPQRQAPAPAGTNGHDAAGETLEEPEELTAKNEPPRRPDGRFDRNGFRRHRAQSQQAGPDDVPRIQELTRRLRDAERERDEARGLAPRAEAPATGREQSPSSSSARPDPVPPAPQSRRAVPPPPPAFTMAKPSLEAFKDSTDPLADYTEAVAEYVHAKKQHDLATRYHTQESTRAAEADDRELATAVEGYAGRMKAKAADPAARAIIEQHGQTFIPATVIRALAAMDTGAEATLALLQHPTMLDELTLATYDRQPTPDLVALVQRRLKTLEPAQAALAPDRPPAPAPRPAPRPPNPVRTAPEAPPRDLPGDDASFEEHAAAFHKPRLSRLRR